MCIFHRFICVAAPFPVPIAHARRSAMKILLAIIVCLSFHSLGFAEDSSVSDEKLRQATVSYLSCWCGVEMTEPQYQENARIVKDAGANIMPLLAALLLDSSLSDTAVGAAAHVATAFPYSLTFHKALQTRRDDEGIVGNPIAVLYILTYLEKYGDDSDLVWIQHLTPKLAAGRQHEAVAASAQLKRRLSNEKK
jgi:hypothetical protein